MEGKTDSHSGYLREPAVLRLLPVGRSTLWQWVKQGKAPAPYKLSPRVTAWKSSDIEDFLKRLAASSA